jgi:hypothetical protein
MSGTLLNGKKINNPDQNSIAYIALHGIPHSEIDTVQQFFSPYVGLRNIRNKEMVDRLNKIFNPFGIQIDFETDVMPLSELSNGGSITERHISKSLSNKLIELYGKGENLISFLRHELKLNVTPKVETNLLDLTNPFYNYDLLGFIKSDLIGSFYIPATAECPSVTDVLCLSKKIGAVSAYAYLGDVGDSVTGDKKSQKFEDDYLEDLFEVIHTLGFNAVTYMPSRNTLAQISRLKMLCLRYGFFEISGEDINSPRQSFICKAMRNEIFTNLIDSTWALIGHEKASTVDKTKGMFSTETINKFPDLSERISYFMKLGLKG